MANTAVLIAGAGPTGLTLALDLARSGIAVRLVEAAAPPLSVPAGRACSRAPSKCSTISCIPEIVCRTFVLVMGVLSFSNGVAEKVTEIACYEAPRILTRPDGYIASIGTKSFSEYAGEATQQIVAPQASIRR